MLYTDINIMYMYWYIVNMSVSHCEIIQCVYNCIVMISFEIVEKLSILRNIKKPNMN